MEAWMEMQQHAQSTQNLSSPTITKSAQASSPDVIYIGKRCDLLGWGNRDVVARGQVHEVNPNAVVHCEPLEEGAFVITLIEIIHPDTPLWKEDRFASTLGEVGPRSLV
ncbi:uncharacterized protein LOC131220559 [Magnolia sinica]|uniref:uncharacterized protein LOC131220559 n=1 Tax=Magnolia sinica TaxID=86752 RepID=UPI00265B0F27|nr:uncharacterized protein LOC131220559 [Magnolia sinica]